jgi:hypothetical protein
MVICNMPDNLNITQHQCVGGNIFHSWASFACTGRLAFFEIIQQKGYPEQYYS